MSIKFSIVKHPEHSQRGRYKPIIAAALKLRGDKCIQLTCPSGKKFDTFVMATRQSIYGQTPVGSHRLRVVSDAENNRVLIFPRHGAKAK